MVEKRFYFGFASWFIMAFVLYIIFLIGYSLLKSFNIFYFIILISLSFTWFYYATNSNILIRNQRIYFPRQFDFVKELFLGLGTFIAVFKPRPVFKIADIISLDISFGIHQLLTIKLKNGNKFKVRMKLFSKRAVINLLKSLKKENPKIDFSKRCNELMKLKNSFSQTKSERKMNKGKKVLALILVGVLVLMFILIFYVQFSGEIKQREFDIASINAGYEGIGKTGEYLIRINTIQGIFFIITVDYSFEEQANEFLKAVEEDSFLLNDVTITYKDRFGIFRNVMDITLSNGQTYNLGTGDS